MTHLLITNDDGVDAAGISVLARAALRAGFDITVAAPSRNRSGASASLTGVTKEGRLQYGRRRLDHAAGLIAFAVEAAPAMIVWAATAGAFGPAPDAVVSGVNHGRNTGRAVLHSGTVGAAMTAAAHGLTAAAFSVDVGADRRPDAIHWDTVDAIIQRSLTWVDGNTEPLGSREGLLLNVNIPDVELGALSGFEHASLARTGTVQVTLTDAGEGWVGLSFGELDEDRVGTDAAALARFAACYSTLTPQCQTHDVPWHPLPSHESSGER
jgi:5'-nucleotidase